MKDTAKILKENGLRVTPTRLQLLDIMHAKKEAMSSQDLEMEMPDADRITLYRTLKTFEDKGIVHQAVDGTNKTKYALCVDNCDAHHHHDNHAHFHCARCGMTTCVENVSLPKMDFPSDLVITQASIILHGYCAKCPSYFPK